MINIVEQTVEVNWKQTILKASVLSGVAFMMGFFVDVEERWELCTTWNVNYRLKYKSIPRIMES